MAFDVFIQAFDGGDAGTIDTQAVRNVLGPYVRFAEGTARAVRLETADGTAELYGYDKLDSGFMVNHVEGDAVWDLIVRAAAASGLVIMPVGCPVATTDERTLDELPDVLRPDARVVRTGRELVALIEAS